MEKIALKEVCIGKVAGGTSAITQRMPPTSGVYAWFRDINISDKGTSDAFYDSLLNRATHRYGVNRAKHLGPQVKVEFVPETNANERELPRLRKACEDVHFRVWMCHVLAGVSQFLPPLYVGATKNLRQRITDHLKPTSPLRTRLDEAKIDIKEVTLRYVELPDLPGVLSDGLDKEVECIIAYMLTPGFSVEYG